MIRFLCSALFGERPGSSRPIRCRNRLHVEELEPRLVPSTLALADQSAEASLEYLRNVMDEYHDRYPVYDDVSSAGNHFHAWAKTGNDLDALNINGSWTDNPQSGATAIRNEFVDTPGDNYGGFYFLNGVLLPGATAPEPNWGTVDDAAIEALVNAKALTFWARGENGTEKIEFFLAGVGRDPYSGEPIAPYPGSSHRYPGIGTTFSLSTQWQQFTIDVAELDLREVLGGFGWVANDINNPGGAVFYVDDIQFELEPAAIEQRLNEPRFLRSYTTLPRQPDPFDDDTHDDIDLTLRNTAFTYDNALAILAFLAAEDVDSLRRARLIGDAFVYASQHDRSFGPYDGIPGFFNDAAPLRTAYVAGDIALPPRMDTQWPGRHRADPGFLR